MGLSKDSASSSGDFTTSPISTWSPELTRRRIRADPTKILEITAEAQQAVNFYQDVALKGAPAGQLGRYPILPIGTATDAEVEQRWRPIMGNIGRGRIFGE
jgi:hypothetical protein